MKTSQKLLEDPKLPATRGELTEWLCDKIERKIGSCNLGNGYLNDILFRCIDYIEEENNETRH
jgi:hypothetical protein